MESIKIDADVLRKLREFAYLYQRKIPEGIHYYYDDILHGNNLEIYCNTYNLPREKLIKMAMVCKILAIYQEIIDLKTIIESETEMLTENAAKEYQEIADELLEKALGLFDGFGSDEQVKEETPDFGDNTNLIVYSNFIEESKKRTENAHSGREEQTKKSVASLILQLGKSDYQSLRKKGLIHQVMGDNKQCYIEGYAVERAGKSSTKISFIRIPISEKNSADIKTNLNLDFNTLFLLISFGDFKNEGISEYNYYSELYLDITKHAEDLSTIINIFKNDFTSETRELAMKLINNGFRITEELTSTIRNR